MFFVDLKVVISVWTVSACLGAWIARRYEEASAERRRIAPYLGALVFAAGLWWLSLTFAIVAILVRKASFDPVVRAVLLSTAAVLLVIGAVGGVIHVRRRRDREERRYLSEMSER